MLSTDLIQTINHALKTRNLKDRATIRKRMPMYARNEIMKKELRAILPPMEDEAFDYLLIGMEEEGYILRVEGNNIIFCPDKMQLRTSDNDFYFNTFFR